MILIPIDWSGIVDNEITIKAKRSFIQTYVKRLQSEFPKVKLDSDNELKALSNRSSNNILAKICSANYEYIARYIFCCDSSPDFLIV